MLAELLLKVSVTLVYLQLHYYESSAITKIRVVTWNVADNGKMENGFSVNAIDKVLGLDNSEEEMPSVYVVGLQENCWMCNEHNLHKIGELFISRIERHAARMYEVIDIEGTRMHNHCQLECKVGMHGTTALIVIAQKVLQVTSSALHQTSGCSSTFPRNHEKGVSAMMVRLKGKQTICFAATHLDAEYGSKRRGCLESFFRYANKQVSWSTSCDAEFLFGDFNTRTGDKTSGPSKGTFYPKTTNFDTLKLHDEFSGSQPYGTDSKWNQNLLEYINKVQPKKFVEGSFNFMPTYSIKSSKDFCNGQFPCYRSNRPLSWTDRIIHTSGTRLKYDAIYEEYSDHFAVFAEFLL